MIRVYYMKLEGDCSKEQSLALYGMLTQKRKELIRRVKNEEVARKRLYTGAFLQFVLSRETGIPIDQLQYEYNEWGKPELIGCPIYFNLSHSGDYAVLAISNSPVGIDIEYKSKKYLSLAERCFCPEEYADILAVEIEKEQRNRFLEYWTMKEAYIKCVGEGLRIPLNSFLIERVAKGVSYVVKETKYFGTFALDDVYCISICNADYTAVKEFVGQTEKMRMILLNEIV